MRADRIPAAQTQNSIIRTGARRLDQTDRPAARRALRSAETVELPAMPPILQGNWAELINGRVYYSSGARAATFRQTVQIARRSGHGFGKNYHDPSGLCPTGGAFRRAAAWKAAMSRRTPKCRLPRNLAGSVARASPRTCAAFLHGDCRMGDVAMFRAQFVCPSR